MSNAIDPTNPTILDRTIQLFLDRKKPEFEDFAEHQRQLQFCGERFVLHQDKVREVSVFVERLDDEVAKVRGANFPRSVLHGVRAHPAGIAGAQIVAQTFAGAFILLKLADEIMAAAREELSDAQGNFERFKNENRKLLAELKLI